jgi:Protein of unknown function (DUF2752)
MGIFPAMNIKRPSATPVGWGYVALAVAVPVVFLLALAGVVPGMDCPWHRWLRFECPMCGSTRAWLAFSCGDWRGALRYNPIFWLWGFWTGVAYLELWQRALGPHTVPMGMRLIQKLARNRFGLSAHSTLILATSVYLNLR